MPRPTVWFAAPQGARSAGKVSRSTTNSTSFGFPDHIVATPALLFFDLGVV